jgi:hypothetical protein
MNASKPNWTGFILVQSDGLKRRLHKIIDTTLNRLTDSEKNYSVRFLKG